MTIEIKKENLYHAVETAENPRAPRWGFNPMLRYQVVPFMETGQSVVPYAQWFPIRNFTRMQENHTTDETKPRELRVEVTAAEALASLRERLNGTGAQSQANWGFVWGFMDEFDAAKMAVISATLVPTLSEIRSIAQELGVPSPISQKCEGTDDLDIDVREHCPTCWLQWLRSEACTTYMNRVAASGREVGERAEDGSVSYRSVEVPIRDLETARSLMTEGFRVGLQQLSKQWGEIATEYSNPAMGRKDITDHEHTYRKDLHQVRPQDRQTQLVAEFAQNVVGGLSGGGVGAVDMAQVLAQMAATQAQTNQILAKLAGGEIQPPTPTAEAPAAPVEVEAQPTLVGEEKGKEEDGATLSPAAKALKEKRGK